MMRKLIKYDFRANLKLFAFLWPAIIVFGLLERFLFTLQRDSDVYTITLMTTTTIFIFAMVAVYLFTIVYAFMRFYNGLLKDEGYLMFTLPVKPWQLILSKLLTSFIATIITLALILLAIFLLIDGISNNFFSQLGQIFELFDLSTLEMLLELILNATAGVLGMLLQIYLACSIGQLVNKHRVLCSVLTYGGLQIVVEIISSIAATLFALGNNANMIPLLWFTLFFDIALCAVYYFFTERLLHRHLNLE